jgi:hypothetical protein
MVFIIIFVAVHHVSKGCRIVKDRSNLVICMYKVDAIWTPIRGFGLRFAAEAADWRMNEGEGIPAGDAKAPGQRRPICTAQLTVEGARVEEV